MRIRRLFRAEAAHYLPLVPPEHKCRRLHGHSYVILVTVDGPIRPDGMVMDFAEISAAVKPIVDAHLDHHLLNDVLENPTSENLCVWLWGALAPVLPYLHEILIEETCQSAAVYHGPELTPPDWGYKR